MKEGGGETDGQRETEIEREDEQDINYDPAIRSDVLVLGPKLHYS